MSDNDSSSIGWFLAGLGLGALVGVLYAPKSGREIRDDIRQAANDSRDFVTTRGQELRGKADQWVAKGKETVSRSKEQISSAVEAGRQAYRDAVDNKS